MPTLHSRCLCGEVAWDADGPPGFMTHCHCARCRKTHGTAFATYLTAPADGFRFERGEDRIVRYESSPDFFRTFCGGCGSVVPNGQAWEGQVFLPAGPLDDDPEVRPAAHIFVGSKAPWYEIPDTLAQFDTYPEGVDAPALDDLPSRAAPGGTRGSCLCGGVAFRVTGEVLRVWGCHCSRCRKARSAAHGANLFTTADGVDVTSGADLFVSYKLPEARFFTHVFCRVCGAPLPRIDRSRNLAVIPMGALDDDPGVRLQHHIFVGSKAPWFEIADRLPQHAEYPPQT